MPFPVHPRLSRVVSPSLLTGAGMASGTSIDDGARAYGLFSLTLLTSFSLGAEGAGAIGRGLWVAGPGPSKSCVSVLLFYTYYCN